MVYVYIYIYIYMVVSHHADMRNCTSWCMRKRHDENNGMNPRVLCFSHVHALSHKTGRRRKTMGENINMHTFVHVHGSRRQARHAAYQARPSAPFRRRYRLAFRRAPARMTGQHAHVKSSAEILQLFESVRALLENARALFLDLMEVSVSTCDVTMCR